MSNRKGEITITNRLAKNGFGEAIASIGLNKFHVGRVLFEADEYDREEFGADTYRLETTLSKPGESWNREIVRIETSSGRGRIAFIDHGAYEYGGAIKWGRYRLLEYLTIDEESQHLF